MTTAAPKPAVPTLDAQDRLVVERTRRNLAAFYASLPGRDRLIASGPLTVNAEELLEIIARLAGEQ